jgi:NAD(P)-dependent dehydrogenase (short-subunit alcohol dehydrogenase family)
MLLPAHGRRRLRLTEEYFDSLFDINAKGLHFTVQKALLLMPDGASIILIASIAASKVLPDSSVYSAPKQRSVRSRGHGQRT